MRGTWLCLVGLIVGLCGCGYIGPVKPPSLHIPSPATSFTVVQEGDRLQYSFLLSEQTTDQVTINEYRAVDLRIGPEARPFNFAAWANTADKIDVPTGALNDAYDRSKPVTGEAPSAPYQDRRMILAVRTSQKGKRYSQWSGLVHLRVVTPLARPSVKLDPDAEGVKVTMTPEQPGAQYRIYRQGPADGQPVEAGVSEKAEFVDDDAQYDTAYRYYAVAFNNKENANAVSKASETESITAKDKFAPHTPMNVAALAGPDSVELSWDRNAERDMKDYTVLRSVDGGAFAPIGGPLTVPAYSDHDVQHGKKYRYEVVASDVRDNRSEPSSPVDGDY